MTCVWRIEIDVFEKDVSPPRDRIWLVFLVWRTSNKLYQIFVPVCHHEVVDMKDSHLLLGRCNLCLRVNNINSKIKCMNNNMLMNIKRVGAYR
jgi:hypothetical protein